MRLFHLSLQLSKQMNLFCYESYPVRTIKYIFAQLMIQVEATEGQKNWIGQKSSWRILYRAQRLGSETGGVALWCGVCATSPVGPLGKGAWWSHSALDRWRHLHNRSHSVTMAFFFSFIVSAVKMKKCSQKWIGISIK